MSVDVAHSGTASPAAKSITLAGLHRGVVGRRSGPGPGPSSSPSCSCSASGSSWSGPAGARTSCCPRPPPVQTLGACSATERFWSALRPRCSARDRLRPAVVIGTHRRPVPASAAAARRRQPHHRPADHAVDRLVPLRDPHLRPQRAGHPVRGRPRGGASIANGVISGIDHVPPAFVRLGHVLGAAVEPLPRHRPPAAIRPTSPDSPRVGVRLAHLMAGELLIIVLGVALPGAPPRVRPPVLGGSTR